MKLSVRRTFVTVDEKHFEAGHWDGRPVRSVAATAVVENPYTGRHVDDLSEMIEASADVGALLAGMAVGAMNGVPVEAYGKGGVCGLGGELEHANAMLTTTFAGPFRDAVGGALAWIPSYTKRAAPGASIDIPFAHKDALYVRSHYGGMSVALPPETPDADEVALIIVVSSRGRLNARVGGLDAGAISVRDGLR